MSAEEVSEQMWYERTSFTDEVYVTAYDPAGREMSDVLENVISRGNFKVEILLSLLLR